MEQNLIPIPTSLRQYLNVVRSRGVTLVGPVRTENGWFELDLFANRDYSGNLPSISGVQTTDFYVHLVNNGSLENDPMGRKHIGKIRYILMELGDEEYMPPGFHCVP